MTGEIRQVRGVALNMTTNAVVLAGIIRYAFLNARREPPGQIPEPADNPPDDPTREP